MLGKCSAINVRYKHVLRTKRNQIGNTFICKGLGPSISLLSCVEKSGDKDSLTPRARLVCDLHSHSRKCSKPLLSWVTNFFFFPRGQCPGVTWPCSPDSGETHSLEVSNICFEFYNLQNIA